MKYRLNAVKERSWRQDQHARPCGGFLRSSGHGYKCGENAYWVQALTAGEFEHWLFGTIELNDVRFFKTCSITKHGVPQDEIAIDYEHGMDMSKGFQASGWIRDMKMDAESRNWLIEFTDTALEEIRDKKWRYFTAEFAICMRTTKANCF